MNGLVRSVKSLEGKAFRTIQDHFDHTVSSIWQKCGLSRPLGLAISGGVDSMALASLCSDFMRRFPNHPGFTGFVVDHQLRAESSEEATQVASELRRLNIESRVIRLRWPEVDASSTNENVETTARRLRYHGLGRACFSEGIRFLLVAHHADDQAETILLRLTGGYTGLGLQGIRPVARIASTHGIYGVNGSGEPRFPSAMGNSSSKRTSLSSITGAESGGISIHRPLLNFTKEQLTAICRAGEVKWFEDPSNADVNLTTRNAVRKLLNHSQLPIALRRPSLCKLAETSLKHQDNYERHATSLSELIQTELDLNIGRLTCEFPLDLKHLDGLSAVEKYHVQATWMRRVLLLVAPKTDIPFQDLHTALELAFGPPKDDLRTTTVANVIVQRDDRKLRDRVHLIMHRAPPKRSVQVDRTLLTLRPEQYSGAESGPLWTDWHFWDNRYWIRVAYVGRHPVPDVKHALRFLTGQDIHAVRSTLSKPELRRFDRIMHEIPPLVRRTLPVITEIQEMREQRVVIPSLAWSIPTWEHSRQSITGTQWIWEVRYREVDLNPIENLILRW